MSKNKEYAATYAEYAMEQMKRYGIPASVTLAQGILESSNGKSELAVKGNAHFGIKCTDEWLRNNGSYLVYTDDRPNEKFCTYSTVADSYEHHSAFFKENTRYKDCFALSADDYKGWCTGLQRAGYATGANYGGLLQQIIERNRLNKFDEIVMREAKTNGITIGTDAIRKQPQESKLGGQYSLPLRRESFMLVTSAFGMRNDPLDATRQQMHKGIDVKTKHEAVFATETGGKVTAVNENAQTAGGKSVHIEYSREDGSRYEVAYLHLDSIQVKAGDRVRAGQQVNVTGNTGTRTTGEHLHIGVKQVMENGNKRDIDPVAYVAEIAERGNIRTELLCNGENLLAKYEPEITMADSQEESTKQETDMPLSVEGWMKKLLSSEDSGVGLGGGDPIMEMITTLYAGLMTLVTQFDEQKQEASREQQMQEATETCLTRKIDIGGLVPTAEKCHVNLSDAGSPMLEATVNGQKISHELTKGEVNSLTKTLGNEQLADADKRQHIASIVGNIVLLKQASLNYNQGMEQGQERTEGVRI